MWEVVFSTVTRIRVKVRQNKCLLFPLLACMELKILFLQLVIIYFVHY